MLALCVGLLAAGSCLAGSWPDHPVKIIAPFAAGGPSDIISRILADKLSKSVAAKCKQIGFNVVADTPQEFAVYVKKEVDKWHRVIVDAKIPQIQ